MNLMNAPPLSVLSYISDISLNWISKQPMFDKMYDSKMSEARAT